MRPSRSPTDPSPSHKLSFDAILASARSNPSIDRALLDRLAAAVIWVSGIKPDALGLAGPGREAMGCS
jgi:hypothetical protein